MAFRYNVFIMGAPQKDLHAIIKSLASLGPKNYGKDFLRTWDKDDNSIKATLLVIKLIRDLFYRGISTKIYQSGIAISIFRDLSTRTKYSFASAVNLLGLGLVDFDEKSSQVAHGETILETANMISFLTRTIGIRDDKYLGVGHNYQVKVAESLDVGYKEKVLANRPSVINLQCDEDHPTQSLSDLSHLISYFGGLEKLKGKKIAMSWAYSPSYGKPLSVPQGVIALMTRFGMNVTLAYPKGYELIPEIEKMAGKFAKKSGGSFQIVHDMKKAFQGADVVYPKSWAPYSVMKQRTKLLRQNDRKGLEELEKQALANNAKFKDWECNEKLIKLTNKGRALYMHCLPADISGVSCRDGEVSKEVFAKARRETYLQASYKPFVIAAMILLCQYGQKSAPVLQKIINKNKPQLS